MTSHTHHRPPAHPQRVGTVRPSARAVAAVAVALALTGLTACGGSDDSSQSTDTDQDSNTDQSTDTDQDSDGRSSPAGVPDDATLCAIYINEYKVILDSPTPFGEDGWEDEAQELVRLAGTLEELAPADQAANAAANVGYFQALADVESASEFVADSNAFNASLLEACAT